jgi:uncharacterized repeat protein (TIGR01451 family)
VTVGADPLVLDEPADYQILVENLGLARAGRTSLDHWIDAGTTFVEASATQGACNFEAEAGRVRCDLAFVAPGASVTVIVTVVPHTPSGEDFDTVSQVSTSSTESQLANNRKTTETGYTTRPPPSTDLDVGIGAPWEPSVGEVVGVSLSITNRGPLPAPGRAQFSVDPTIFRFLGFQNNTDRSLVCSYEAPLVDCSTNGQLEVGYWGTIVAAFELQQECFQRITARLLVSGFTDPNPDNDEATTAVFTRDYYGDLQPRLAVDEERVQEGAIYPYTATLVNEGPKPADGSLVMYVDPGIWHFSELSDADGLECVFDEDARILKCVSTRFLGPGESASASIHLALVAPGSHTLTLYAHPNSVPDHASGNNEVLLAIDGWGIIG